MSHRFLRSVLVCFLLVLAALSTTAQPCPDTQPTIIGPVVVSNNQLGVVYSTPDIPGHTYLWTVTGGSISSGSTTNQISVNWGVVGTGTISLTEMNPALGCSTTVARTITVQPLLISYLYYTNTSCYGDVVSFWDASVADPAKPIVNWAWTFGDGGVSALQNPTHQYLPPYNVTYTISLIVTNSEGMRDTIYDAVYVNPDQFIPHPNFTATVPPCLYTPVPFNSSLSTTPPGTGAIIHYDWDFGDPSSGAGNFSTLPNPTHVFTAPGTYNVNLEITNERYCINDTTITVTILPSLPDALYSFSTPTCLNNPVFFSDLSTFPVGRDIVTWIWNYADGSMPDVINAPASPNTIHVFPGLGPYPVLLTVVNNIGCRDSVSLNVKLDPSPIADFAYDAACVGDTVHFTNLTQYNNGPAITSYSWNFDDPSSGFNTSTLKDPSHVFSAIGTYNVRLISINSSGCPDTIVKPVIVFPTPGVEYTWNFGAQNNVIEFHIDSVITPLPMIGNMITWNFGDGEYGYGQHVIHTYPAASTYFVTCTVTDTIGCSNSITHPVGVPAIPVSFFSSNSPVCDGQEVCFTDLSSVPTPPFGWITTWIWNYGDGSPNDTIYFPNDPNVCHTYAVVDTFAVTLTVIDNNGYIDDYTANVVILPNPVANFIFSVACEDQIVNFTDYSSPNGGGNIITWDWNFGDPASGINNTSGLQNPTHIFSVGDSCYTVRLIIVNFNNCRDTITKQVCVFPHPPVDFTYDTACIDQVVTFMADTTVTYLDSIATWSWDFGDGNPLGTDPITTQHIYTAPGIYTITLYVTDIHGCQNQVSHTIEVHPLPVANFIWNAPVCQGNAVQFFDQSYIPPAYTGYVAKWEWDFGDGVTQTILLPASPNIQHIYTGPGTFFTVRLTVWSNDSCSQFIEKLVTLIPAPTANFSNTAVTCAGQAICFNDLSQTNGGGNLVFWNWDFGDPGSGIDNVSTLQNPCHTFAFADTFSVTLIVTNVNNCTDTIIKDVIVSDLPVADFTADTVCLGTPTQFTDLTLPNAFGILTYVWDFGDGLPTSGQQNPSHTYATYGVFTVTLTVTNTNGCIHTVTKDVLVNPLPVAAFTFSAPNCQGSAVQFTNLSTTVPGYLGSIVRWIWEFGDGSTQNVLFPNNPNVTHIYTSAAINFTVRLTVKTSDSCEHFIEHLVTLIPSPVANFVYPPTNCASMLVPFTDQSQANGGGSIITWQWNFDDPGSGANNFSTAPNPSHSFTTAGTFDVSLIVTNASNCSDTIIKQVVIDARPVANFSADSACLNALTSFTDLSTTTSGSITGWFWEFGDGQTSISQHPTHLYGAAQVYNVKLTVTTSAGCVKDTTQQVVVLQAATAAFSYDAPACAGDSVQFNDLSFTPSGYITTWVWNFGDGVTVTINFPASPDVKHSYSTGGTYPVTLTVTTSNGCTAIKINQVIISAAPLANFSNSSNSCAQIPVQFNDQSQQNSGGPIIAWAWDFGDPGSGASNTSNLQNPLHPFSTGGTFTVNLIVTNINGCIDSISKSVTVNAAPVAAFSADTACFGTATQFTDGSTGGTITGWLWNFGDPASGGSNSSTQQNPTHVFTNIGTFNVTLTVTNSNTCTGDTVIQVNVNPAPVAMFSYTAACVGNPTQFTDLSTAPGSQVVSWLWDFGDGVGTSTLQNPSYTYPTPGTYDVTLLVTNLSNCVDSIVIPVVTRPTPVADFAYSSMHCPAGQVNFQDQSLGIGASIVDHYWIFEPGYTSNLINPVYVFGVTDTTYLVTLIVTDNFGCQDTIIDSVYVQPGMDFMFANDTVCYGYLTQFNAMNLAPGDSLYSVQWNFGDPASGPNNVSYLYNPVHLFTAPGTYVVKLKAWNSDNCVDSVYQTVQVYDLPAPDYAWISEPCDSVIYFNDLTQPGFGGVTTWEWHFGDGSLPLIINAPASGSTQHQYNTIGQYQAKLIITNSAGCVDSITKTVERYPCILAAIVSADTSKCARSFISFADSSKPVSRISQWHWEFGDGLDTTYSTYSENISHQFEDPGVYNVKLIINAIVSGTSFSDSTTVPVTIRPTPDPGFTTPNTCFNLVTMFTDTTVTFGPPVTTYNWNFGEPSSGASNTSSLSNPGHQFGSPGYYTVNLKVSNFYGCSDSIAKMIRINAVPEADFENSIACEGDFTYFTDLSSAADTTLGYWHWDFGVSSLVLDVSTDKDPAYKYPVQGDYTVQLIVQDYYGCRDTVDSTIRVNITPVSAFSIIDNVDGLTGKIHLQNLTTGASGYYWDFGNGKTSEEEEPIVAYTEDGTYIIELISMNEYGCYDTTFYTYEVLFKGLYVPNAFSPSSSNINVMMFKPVGINLKRYHVMLFDVWGHLLWESTLLDNRGRPEEGWDGKFEGNPMPMGTYMWKIEATFIDDTPWNGNDIGKSDISTIGTVSLIR